jgi:hypothetical protein
MTHWIKERLAQRREIALRQSRIRAEALATYQALVGQLEEDIQLANQEEGFDHKIMIEGNKMRQDLCFRWAAPDSRAFQVLLSRQLDEIYIRGSIHFTFSLDMCKSGAICLRDEHGHEIPTVGEAARRILEPFLFPEFSAPINQVGTNTCSKTREQQERCCIFVPTR